MPAPPVRLDIFPPFHLIRSVKDWPSPGIEFKDWNDLLAEPGALKSMTDLAVQKLEENKIKPEIIVGAESRGFILGATIAAELGIGFVPLRKPGKTPPGFHSHSYDLEYGSDTIELAHGLIHPGTRVLVHDDLLATGGTAAASAELLNKIEAEISGFLFALELPELQGREKLMETGSPVLSLHLCE